MSRLRLWSVQAGALRAGGGEHGFAGAQETAWSHRLPPPPAPFASVPFPLPSGHCHQRALLGAERLVWGGSLWPPSGAADTLERCVRCWPGPGLSLATSHSAASVPGTESVGGGLLNPQKWSWAQGRCADVGPPGPPGGGYRCQAGVGGRLVPPLWAELQLCLCECEADWPKGGFA